MKRLLAYIGFTMFVTFAIVYYFQLYGGLIICSLALVLLICSLCVNKLKNYARVIALISLVAVCANIYSFVFTYFYYQPLSTKYYNQVVEIEGKVVDCMESYTDSCNYQIKTTKVNGKDEKLKIVLSSPSELDVDYGYIIKSKVLLTECTNPSYKSEKITYTAVSESYYIDYQVLSKGNKGIIGYANDIRKALLHSTKTLVPDAQGGLCCGIAYGDKFSLPEDDYYNFTQTGLVHAIVVSGMHLSILVHFLLFLMKGFPDYKFGGYFKLCVVTVFIVSFILLTGATRSSIRAGIMIFLVTLANTVMRKYDSITGLGVAAILQTGVNPYAVADIGFLLSYSSVLGIITIYPKIKGVVSNSTFIHELTNGMNSKKFLIKNSTKLIRKGILYFWDTFALSSSAVILIMPVTALFFGSVSPVAVLLSLVVSIPINVILIVTLMLSVFWYIPALRLLSYPLVFIAYYCASWVLNITEFSVNFDMGQIYVDSIIFIIWFAISGVFVVYSLMSNSKRKNFCVALISSAFLLGFLSLSTRIIASNSTSLKIYPCGKGVTVSFEDRQNTSVLASGGESIFKDDFFADVRKGGDELNHLIIPSTRKTDTRYVADLLKEFDVNKLLLYYINSTNEKVYDMAQKCEDYNEFSEDEKAVVILNDEYKDVVFNVNNHTYQYISGNGKSILILSEKGNCKEIPAKYRLADCVIMCQQPKNFKMLSYNTLIWSNYESPSKKLMNFSDEIIRVEDEIIEIDLQRRD